MVRDLYGDYNYRYQCEKCGERFRSMRGAKGHESRCIKEAK